MTIKHSSIEIKFEITKPIIELKHKTELFTQAAIGKKAELCQNFVSRIDASTSFANTLAFLGAIEKAYGIQVSKQTRTLRELSLKIEIINSHLNHLYKKIIPKSHGIHDYVEYLSKHEKEHAESIAILQKIQKALEILTKRYPHPINSVIGGHIAIIDDDEKKEIVQALKEIIPVLLRNIDVLHKKQSYALDIINKYSSLWSIDQTPLMDAKIKISDDQPIEPGELYDMDPSSYVFVGPIARLNNGSKLLSGTADKIIKKYNIKFPITNPYLTPLAMAIESVHLIERSIEVLLSSHLEYEARPIFSPQKSKGDSAIESAKGTIYHTYEVDEKGIITSARIILPSQQNESYLHKAVKNLPFDPDKKTRKELIEEIDYLIDVFYL